jgi:hypothetical protein
MLKVETPADLTNTVLKSSKRELECSSVVKNLFHQSSTLQKKSKQNKTPQTLKEMCYLSDHPSLPLDLNLSGTFFPF